LTISTQYVEIISDYVLSNHQGARAMRILVADDEPTILEGYLYFFTRRGHEVIIAESAEELLAKFAATPCDVVITDNSMGGKKTGLDALREIRAGGSKIPVAVVSGDDIQEHVQELGGLSFMKPIRMSELLQKLIEAHTQQRPLS